jgi:hypothetical protein
MWYRKKPVPVLAIQLREDNMDEVEDFLGDWPHFKNDDGLTLLTLEGPAKSKFGDYLIRGVEREVYSCKESVFLKTYEPAWEGVRP